MCGNLRFGARWTGKGLRRAPPWSEGGAFSWSSEKSGRRRLRLDLPSVTPPGPSQNFLKRYKAPSNHWIGLRRESSHHIWRWMDNTEYNNTHVLRLLIFLLCLCMVMCVSCVYEIRNVV
ncbi:early activation antigen CD69-like [Papio anubis]|uniref:early activation antigen CD69-like n=1 Tax=Papio anubis TaxID=9555 RepID=UPI0012ADF347|nr:early activation antigen CD69-like [Papio anubis]